MAGNWNGFYRVIRGSCLYPRYTALLFKALPRLRYNYPRFHTKRFIVKYPDLYGSIFLFRQKCNEYTLFFISQTSLFYSVNLQLSSSSSGIKLTKAIHEI